MDKEKILSLSVYSDITLKESIRKLNETGERILFIVDNAGKLVGTLTDGDIRRGIVSGIDFSEKIEKIMCKNFVAFNCNVHNVMDKIKQIMLETMIDQVPIIDDSGKIVEIISWANILKEKKDLKQNVFYPNHVVIMAGGKGVRLDPFTRVLPKPLMPIGNKPIIELIMERFYQYGFSNFIYTLNYKKEYIKLFLKECKLPYSIDWCEESDFLGTAGGLSLVKSKINDTFFVINCDTVLEIDFAKALKWHKEQKSVITIIGCHSEFKIPFGVLELSNGKLDKIREKPVQDFIINTGAYLMEPRVFSYIPENRPIDMNQLIDIIIEKEEINVYPICTGWLDIGQLDEYNKIINKLGGCENV